MKSRALIGGVAAAVLLVLVVAIWILRVRAPNEQIVRVTIRRSATPEENEKDIALALEKKLAGVPRLISQRIEIDKYGVTADCRFEPKNTSAREEDVRAVAGAGDDRLVSVEELPPDAPAIWIFGPTNLKKELAAISNVSVEVCGGEPTEDRVRVKVDPERVKAMGADIVEVELAIGPDDAMTQARGATPDLDELGKRTLHGEVHLRDVATLTLEKRPLACSAFSSDGKTTFAHAVHPLPGLTSDARARLDAIARDAHATIVHEDDALEVQFVLGPTATYASQRRTAADYAVRGKVAGGLDVVGARVFLDGSGSIVVRRPAKVDSLRALIAENAGVAWGGIRGAHRLEVTLTGGDRKALSKRAHDVAKRVATIDGVGVPVMLAPNEAARFVYDVDDEEAALRNVPPAALHVIAESLQGDTPVDAPVVLEAGPLDQLMIAGGAPLLAYIHKHERLLPIRLLRVDQKPAIELAWEVSEPAAETRARQALGDSADASVRVLPPF